MIVQAPGGLFSGLEATLEQNGKRYPVYALEAQNETGASRRRSESADQVVAIVPIGKQAIPDLRRARRASSSGRRGPCSTACGRPSRSSPRRAGAARAAARRPCSPPSTTSTSAAASSSCTARRPEDVRVGRPRRRQGVSGLSRPAAPASRAIRRCASPSSRCSSTSRSTRRSQVFARDAAGNEAVAPLDHMVFPKPYQQEPHRDRRRVPAARRAGHRVQLAGREDPDRRRAGGVPEDQRRPAARRTTSTSPTWRRRARPSCCSRTPSSSWATRRSKRSSPTRAPTSTRARKSTSRSTSASTSP